eukprot:COSAG01_NODE_5951_length_3938_cov_35.878875_4_plen_73_part_00
MALTCPCCETRYIDDLASRLLSTHRKVGVTAEQIDAQLAMLVEYVPEWCSLRADLGQTGRKLFVVTEKERDA